MFKHIFFEIFIIQGTKFSNAPKIVKIIHGFKKSKEFRKYRE